MEDIYYYHALEMLSYLQPSIDAQRRFSVQSAYFHYTQGIHGFDKGWYLTTVQIAEMLYQDQQYILSTNFRFATVNIPLIHIFWNSPNLTDEIWRELGLVVVGEKVKQKSTCKQYIIKN